MSLADYYSDSYPPELWETPAAPVAAARQSATDEGGTVPDGTVPPLPAAEDAQVSGLSVDPDSPVPGTVEELTDEAAAALRAAGPLPELPADEHQEGAVELADGTTVTGTLPVEAAVVLTATAGTPGTYSPELPAADRPRNVLDLTERGVTPDPVIPWGPGQGIPVGSRGKRAHWDGETWRSGEAPPFQTRTRR